MDVSNSTGEDTHYRTGSDTTKTVQWMALPSKKTLRCADPKGSWTISFKLHDGGLLSKTFTEPMATVTLVQSGKSYRIAVARKTVKKPVQPLKPVRAKSAA